MKGNKKGQFYCGTSNIVLPVPNKSHFPPGYRDKTRLTYYASIFNSLEVNSSFYKIPLGRTVAKWTTEVPPGFTFSFKLWQGITHARELLYDQKDVGLFMNAISMAGDRKGCLLIQFPAGITGSYIQRLRKLLDDLAQTGLTTGWKLAIEFRHPTWYRDPVYQLLEQHNAAVVQHDMPRSPTPAIDMATSFAYIRFHGEKGDYRGSYAHGHMQEYAGHIKDLLEENKDVYAYFNNTIGDAVYNAMELRDL